MAPDLYRVLLASLLAAIAATACGEASGPPPAPDRGIVTSTTDTPTPIIPTPTFAIQPTLTPVVLATLPPASLAALPPRPTATLDLSSPPTSTATFAASPTLPASDTPAPTTTNAPTNTPAPSVTTTPPPPTSTARPTDTPAPTATAAPSAPPTGRCSASASVNAGGGADQNRLLTAPTYYREVFSLQTTGSNGTTTTTGTIDQADTITHEQLTVPGYSPIDLYVTPSGYISSVDGVAFTSSASAPPQLAAFVNIQNGICDWLVSGFQSMTTHETGPVNATTATHITQTWAAGRQLRVPGYSGTTDGPTTAELWYAPILDNLVVKTTATIRLATAAGPATVDYQNDVSNVSQRHTITVPAPTR